MATRRPPALVALALALAWAGCDDLEEIESEDQRIQVGAAPAVVCPEAMAGAPGDGVADVRATIFAGDGTTASDETVVFETTRGSLMPETDETDDNGLAATELTAQRAPDNASVVVTATIENGESSEREIAWPVPPTPCLQADFTPVDPTLTPRCSFPGGQLQVEVGETFDLIVSVFDACNVAGIEMQIGYDPTILRFEEARPTGLLENMGSVTTTDPPATGGAGVVTVDYRQEPLDLGTNSSQSALLTITFTAIGVSPGPSDPDPGAGLTLDSYSVVPSDGLGNYPNSEFQVAVPIVFTVDPP